MTGVRFRRGLFTDCWLPPFVMPSPTNYRRSKVLVSNLPSTGVNGTSVRIPE